MKQNVQNFNNLFEKLFQKGLPSFWDENDNLISQEKYDVFLTQARIDHSKFEDLKKRLDGNVVANKLTNDFEIRSHFKEIKVGLPPISYVSCIELEVLIKEMMDYDIPCQDQWKEVERLGKKYI